MEKEFNLSKLGENCYSDDYNGGITSKIVYNQNDVKEFINILKIWLDWEFKGTVSLGNHIKAKIDKLAGDELR